MTCFTVSSANSKVCFYPKESSLILHLQWRIWFLASRFLIGAVVPAPTPSSLTPQIPDPRSQPSSQQKNFHSVPLLLMEFSPNVCIHHSQLNLIHFCLNCMTPRRIPLKDSVYSLHSFLKGTYQGLGNMIESIPAHSSLCLPPPPRPQGLTETLPFSQCRDQELQVAVDTGTQYNQISAGCLSRLG